MSTSDAGSRECKVPAERTPNSASISWIGIENFSGTINSVRLIDAMLRGFGFLIFACDRRAGLSLWARAGMSFIWLATVIDGSNLGLADSVAIPATTGFPQFEQNLILAPKPLPQNWHCSIALFLGPQVFGGWLRQNQVLPSSTVNSVTC